MKFFCSDRVCFEWLCVNYCFLMFEYDCVHSTVAVCVCLCVQACWGGGEVSWAAPPSPADVSGQTNHQQRDGAGEDEESRADDAAEKPCSGEASPERRGGCAARSAQNEVAAFVNNVKVFWLAVSSQCRERGRAVVLRPPVTISRGWRTSSNRPRWRPGWVKSTPVTVYDESKGFPICLLLYSNLPLPVWKW